MDLFENKILERSIPRAFQFLGSRPTVNMCSDTISVTTRFRKGSKSLCLMCHPWIGMLAHTVLDEITENHMYKIT